MAGTSIISRLLSFRILLLILVLPLSMAIAQDLPAPSQHYPRERTWDIQHYRIDIEPDFKNRSVAGSVDITLMPLREGMQTLELDAEDLDIREILVRPGPGQEQKPVGFRQEDEKLYINLTGACAPGDLVTVHIRYSATPKTGLFFFGPDAFEPNKQTLCWSQGEDEENHAWVPIWDYPNDKATSEMIVTVPNTYTVVSNGRLEVETTQNGKKQVHWVQDQPHSSYLISLVAGELSKVEDGAVNGIPISYYTRPGTEDQIRNAFGATGECLKFFADYIGVPYPWAKYAQVAVPEFIFGGMENTSASTQSDRVLYPEHLRDWGRPRAETLMAHELAHQWWGDMVTAKDWAHIWTGEGFATYFEALFIENKYGRNDFINEMLDSQQIYLRGERNTPRPILYGEYVRPYELFITGHVYQKAAWVLHMLRRVVGEQNFRAGIKKYLLDHAFDLVETDDLRLAMTETSGQDLEWFFDQWIRGAGHPVFEVEYVYREAAREVELTVRQTQETTGNGGIFRTPVDIGIATNAGITVHEIFIEEAEQVFTLPSETEPVTVLFDHGSWLLKVLEFEKPIEELIWQAEHDPDLGGQCLAVAQIARDFPEDRQAFDVLVRLLNNPRLHHRVRTRAVDGLTTLGTVDARDALMQAYHAAPGFDVQRAIVMTLGRGKFRDDATAAFLVELIGRESNDVLIGHALNSLGHTGAPQAYNVLTESLHRPSHMSMITLGALDGLEALDDRRALPALYALYNSGASYDVRYFALEAMAALQQGDPELMDLLLAATNDRSWHVRDAAIKLLGDSKSPSVREHLFRLYEQEEETSMQHTTQKTIEAVDKRIKEAAETPIQP